MKIFDCFIYNGEDLVLDIRLNELQNIVNKFIIVESRFNHQGKQKKLKFDFLPFPFCDAMSKVSMVGNACQYL